MFRLAINLFGVAVCFAGFLTAATEPKPAGVRALLLVPGGPVVKLHPLSGSVVGEAVQIGARGLSDSFKPGSRVFSLAIPDAKQESGYRAVANVVLPAEGKDFIILLEPANNTFKVHLVNGGEPRFGADSVLFFNATEIALAATLGREKILIKPRVAVFAKAPARGVKNYYQVTFYEQDKGKVRPFANTRWPHRDKGRCYLFFYRSQTGRLIYQAVDEELMPVTASE